MWWQDAVVYQIYPRSFQDSDADGVGDLRGVADRLDHLSWLGVDALWLSPIYPSPLADFGYDVSDFEDVDPIYGSLADFDALVAAAHERGLRLLMDLVPCHTSIEHPWRREHPDWYIWGPDGPDPPNNWLAAFGGSAWSRDPANGRWYLHTFYPEQPDLDWHHPEVPGAMGGAMRFWLDRGVDGFRLDAIDRLVKDRELRDEPRASEPFALPLRSDEAQMARIYSANAEGTERALAALRRAAGDAFLVGEVYLPTAMLGPYLDYVDRAFVFELFHAPWDAERLAAALHDAARLIRPRAAGPAWVLSNHDFRRLATRFGPENGRAAAVLLLTLPGTAFVYQGEELGMADGPGHDPPYDRAGRDSHRHPMQWDPSPKGGFSEGHPWLPVVDPAERNVADQRADPGSLLHLYRDLIALRPELGQGLRVLEPKDGVLAFERGRHVVAVNTTGEERPLPSAGEVLLATHQGNAGLAPHGAAITMA